ncbi:MAG: hypothetical protein J7J10_05585 [Deltaproteobacteria bacterium]|nr:hypothetical protein [Deltaproteobacteria bacterium]
MSWTARVFLIVLIIVVAYVALKSLTKPKSMGVFGHYRAANISKQLNIPTKLVGKEACKTCHEQEYNDLCSKEPSSAHRDLQCEACHGLGVAHPKEGVVLSHGCKIPDVTKQCMYCHEMLPSKPKSMPQITLKGPEAHFPGMACTTCHTNTHKPAFYK